jgi:type IV pilus assembly protein PilQ
VTSESIRRIWALANFVVCCILCPETARATAAPVSLDVRDLDIYDVVRLLSTQADVNIVLDATVPHHDVTLRLHNVTFAQALATLAATNDLQTVKVGNVLYLGPSDSMNRRYPSARASGTETAVIRIRNGVPDEIAKQLDAILPHGTIIVADPRTSSLLVTGSSNAVERARTLAADFDRTSADREASLAMHYVKASDALKALQSMMTIVPPQSAYAADQQNEIVLAGSSAFIDRATELVGHIDQPGQQVRYDVRVTDLEPTESSNVGFLFGGADVNGTQQAGSGSTITTFLRNSLAINATINALISKGEAQILARPSLSSLNNVAASLLVGQQYPIVYFDARTGTQQVQFVNIGVNLNVTPTIGTDGSITTDLETDYSQVTGSVRDFPIITTRKAQSTLRVRNGETIVIAGLFSDVDRSTLTKVPFLADLPLIGEIFRNRAHERSRDEVVFLITPHLVADDDPNKAIPPAGLTGR